MVQNDKLDEKWNEDTLRVWAISQAHSGMVQAQQVLALLDEIVRLRQEVSQWEATKRIPLDKFWLTHSRS